MYLDPHGRIELRIAIIEQANKDYKNALLGHDRREVIKLEKFYRSAWGELLTDHNGENIINRIKKEVEHENYVKWHGGSTTAFCEEENGPYTKRTRRRSRCWSL